MDNQSLAELSLVLQLIGTIKRTIVKKVRTETILKIYNTFVLSAFLFGSENWTLNSLTKAKIWSGRNEVTETSGRLHPLWLQNDYISRELRITGILDTIEEYRRNWFQHLQRMPQNRIPLKSYH